jgi:amino acid permease
VIDPILYVIYAPFGQIEAGGKQSSITTIFTCWNTMLGSGIVALPWTFSNSGFLLGIIICLVSLGVSYRTCILMIRTAGNDKEYFDTLFKYWGRWAYYVGILSTLLIMFAAVCSYFVILSQMLYPIILALIEWIFRHPLPLITEARFDVFSQAYIAIIIFFIEVIIVCKRDLSIFIKVMSYGSFFIVALMLFIVGVGFYGMFNTHYIVESTPTDKNTFSIGT